MAEPTTPQAANPSHVLSHALGGCITAVVACIAVTLCMIACEVPHYFSARLMRDINVSFLGYMSSVSLRLLVYSISLGLIFATLLLLLQLVLFAAGATSSVFAGYLGTVHPDELTSLRLKLPNAILLAISGVWTLSGLGGLVLSWNYVVEHFWVLFLPATLAAVIAYGLVMYNHRQLGIWAFYQLRRPVLPYVVATPISCVVAFYASNLVFHVSYRLGFWGDTGAELVFPDPVVRAQMMNHFIAASSPLRMPFADALEATVWATLVGVLIVWILPVILKRDVMAIALSLIAAAAPFILGPATTAARDLLPPLSPHVPPAMLSIVLVILANIVKDGLLAAMSATAKCSRCGSRNARTDRFCSTCGAENPVART